MTELRAAPFRCHPGRKSQGTNCLGRCGIKDSPQKSPEAKGAVSHTGIDYSHSSDDESPLKTNAGNLTITSNYWKDISLLDFGTVQNYRCLSLIVDVVVVVAVVVAHLPRTVDSPRHESHLATRSCFVHRQSASSNRLKNAWAITDQAMKTAVIFWDRVSPYPEPRIPHFGVRIARRLWENRGGVCEHLLCCHLLLREFHGIPENGACSISVRKGCSTERGKHCWLRNPAITIYNTWNPIPYSI